MPQGNKPDRYVSFIGIEGEKNSRRLMEMLRRHIDHPDKSNRFWELFEEYDDQHALKLLEQIEAESC